MENQKKRIKKIFFSISINVRFLEKFRKDIKRLKKPKDKYLQAKGRVNMPFEQFRKDI